MTMDRWMTVCDALEGEVGRLRRLREHADRGAELMMALDVSGLEAWTEEQACMLAELGERAQARHDAMRACVALEARGAPLSGRLTLLTLIQCAPVAIAARLRKVRGMLRELQSELALVTARNEILARQVLTFTQDFGRSLAPVGPSSYDARGRVAVAVGGGELLALSL